MTEIESKRPEGPSEVAADQQHMQDIGAELYLEVQQYSRAELEAERKRVLRKVDRVILPIVGLTLHFLLRLHSPNRRHPDMRYLHAPILGQTIIKLRLGLLIERGSRFERVRLL